MALVVNLLHHGVVYKGGAAPVTPSLKREREREREREKEREREREKTKFRYLPYVCGINIFQYKARKKYGFLNFSCELAIK